MGKYIINIEEFVIGKVISLEDYEKSFRNTKFSYSYIKNFVNGRYLGYENTKNAFIANEIARNYANKHGDGALLVFCQIKSDKTVSVCFIDSAAIDKNNSIVKLSGLNAEKFKSDANKIEELLLFYKCFPSRKTRYFISGISGGEIVGIIKQGAYEMDDKFLKDFLPAPFLSPNTKNSHYLKIGGVIFAPLLMAVFIGHSFMSSAAQRVEAEAEKLVKERSLLQGEIEKLRLNPFIINEKKYGNFDHKRIAI